jgi:hypothetical protein
VVVLQALLACLVDQHRELLAVDIGVHKSNDGLAKLSTHFIEYLWIEQDLSLSLFLLRGLSNRCCLWLDGACRCFLALALVFIAFLGLAAYLTNPPLSAIRADALLLL